MIPPKIEILMPTRNRPADLERCLRSLASIDHPSWSLVVVDQSTNENSAAVIKNAKLPNLKYIPQNEVGISRARNAALAESTAPILAFVDDDCTVPANWLRTVEAAFNSRPGAELILGRVTAGAYDPREALLPVFEPKNADLDLWTVRAMGAAMYLRRSLYERLGKFDELLGVGSGIFESGEDTDYRYRALSRGVEVAIAPEIYVVHHGARSYKNGSARRLMWTTAFARGATDMKLLRMRELTAPRIIADTVWSYWKRMRIPWPLAYYALGLGSSFRFRLDRRRGVYER